MVTEALLGLAQPSLQAATGLWAATNASRSSRRAVRPAPPARIVARAAGATSRRNAAPAFPPQRLQEFQQLLSELTQVAVTSGPKGVERAFQGGQALASIAFDWLQGDRPQPPALLRKLFEKLGATYIKLGQFIASTPTLFPPEYVNEFQSCLDKTPPIDYAIIRSIIASELKRPIDEVFESIDPVPLASASIAQVHSGVLKGSSAAVAIKVLKPGVESILSTDLSFLVSGAKVLEFLAPEMQRTSVAGILDDIRQSMLEEVDFKTEAQNIEAFRSFLFRTGVTSVTAPEVYTSLSTKRILVMERFYGKPLTDLAAIRRYLPGSSPETLLIDALNTWFASVLLCESFHADVHGGNLMVLQDGRVGFIDFGIVGRISKDTFTAMQAFLGAFSTEDYRTMALSLSQMGATSAVVDIDSFAKDLKKVLTQVRAVDADVLLGTSMSVAATVQTEEINALLLDVVRVGEAYGLRFPREFGLLLKQLLYFDRYTRLLAPTLRILDDDRIMVGNT